MTRLSALGDFAHPDLAAFRNSNPPIKFRTPTVGELRGKQTQEKYRPSALLQYKILKSDARLVQTVLDVNGFSPTEGHSWNVIWLNGYTRPYVYEGLNPYQRVNHFPHSFEVTRKDRLCQNIMKMQSKHSKGAFNIVPETFLLPQELREFQKHHSKLKERGVREYWIVKPNAMSRGRGIYIVGVVAGKRQ